MITVASDSWFVADESEKTSSDGLFSAWYVVIPLKPLIQPVKLFVVIPVYVIISFSILKRP